MGKSLAIDGSDLPRTPTGSGSCPKRARAEAERVSDPDASWGHRSAVCPRNGGGYYGYKVHAAVDTLTGLPVAWTVETAKEAETTFALRLLDGALGHRFAVKIAIMTSATTTARSTMAAWTAASARSRRFARRRPSSATITRHRLASTTSGRSPGPTTSGRQPSGRCPTGECAPKSTWNKADRLHPLILRHTAKSDALYKSRGAVEREFERLKHEALLPLRRPWSVCTPI